VSDETPAEVTPERRRPGRLRRWVVRPFVWGVLCLGVLIAGSLLFVQSRYARRQLAARMVAAVSEKMGRQIQVGDLDFTFLPPAVELRDVVIPGPRPSDPAVARVPLARVQATWSDLRRRVLRLEQIEAIRPEIHLQFNPDGTNNLPRWKTDSTSGPRRFEVLIGRILVQDGTLHLNELHVPMSIDAKAVWGRITGRADRHGEGGDRLDMLVTAQEVVTALPSARPYAATVSAKGSLDPKAGQIRIAAARIAGPDLHADVDGLIDWRSDPHRVALRVDGRGDTRWVNRVGYMEEPIEGPFTFRGRVDVQGTESLYTGTVASPRVAILNRVFRDVAGQLAGGNDSLRFDIARAGYADGRAQGRVTVDWSDREHHGIPVGLDLTLSGMRIQPLIHDQFPEVKIPVVDGLAGTVRGRFRYLFEHAAAIAGDGTADLRIEAVDRGSGLPIAGTAPVEIRGGVLSSDAIRLTAPGQVLSVDGFVFDLRKTAGKLSYRLDSRDLGKVAPLLLQDKPAGEPPPFWLPTAGQGVVAGDLAIDHTDYVTHMSLDLQNALAGITSGTRVDSARGSLTLRPTAVDDLRIALLQGDADLTVSGRVPLAEEGKARASAPLALAVDAHGWPAAGVAAFLLPPDVASAWPVGGQVTGRLDLGGWVGGGPDDPNNLNGRSVFTVSDLAVRGIAVGRLQGTVVFEGARVRVEQAVAETPAGNVQVNGAFDGTRLSFNLDAPQLSLAAEPFRDALGGRLTGRMSVAAVVGGTVERPEVTVRVLGDSLALDGRVLGDQGGGQGKDGTAQALLSWDGRSLQATGSLLGLISFDGGGRLDTEQADLAFDIRSDALGALARLATPQPLPDFKGSFAGSIGLAADFAQRTWRGELLLTDLRAQYQGHAIANREPVVVEMLPDRVEIRSFYVGELKTESELFAAGRIGLGGLGGKVPLDLKFQSTLSAAWAGLFLPNVQVEGFLDLLATVRGTLDDPVLNGQGVLRQARLVLPQFPQELSNIQGEVFFNRNGIEVEGVRADMGGGKLQASGRVSLPRPGEALSYRLQVTATGISVRYPEGFLARGDADLALVSTPQSRVIRGAVRLDRLFYLEDVKLGTLDLLRGLLRRQRLEVAQTDPFLTSTQLNVQIDGPEALRINNNVAKLRGGVDLSVQGTLANPILFGRVELEPGGTLVYSDNEYELERGLLTFNNPYRIDPVIDFVARTQVRSYDISLSLSGTLDRLSAKFSSDEGLADLEVLALLATGQELEGTGRLQAPGERTDADSGSNVGASTFLAGQAASLVSERVGSLFGFDRFRIDPLAGTTGAIGGVRLTVGKRISKNLLVTYSSNPAASEEYLVRAEWQVADNLVLVFTRDGKADNYALDAEWEKRF
jgi:autotransporter translocation and assembly factor TamB